MTPPEAGKITFARWLRKAIDRHRGTLCQLHGVPYRSVEVSGVSVGREVDIRVSEFEYAPQPSAFAEVEFEITQPIGGLFTRTERFYPPAGECLAYYTFPAGRQSRQPEQQP